MRDLNDARARARLSANDGGEIAVAGDLTLQTVPEIWAQARDIFASAGAVTIDLAAVGSSDSAGVALLVDWLRQARENDCALRFANVPAQMRAIIRVTDLETVLPLQPQS